MPKLYLAKVNLNSRIFSVYEKELELTKVLDYVYQNVNENEKYKIQKSATYTDVSGNLKRYIKSSEYNFAELKKEKMIITGLIMRKFTKPNEELNTETKKIETVIKTESVGIRFYFDINKEMVAFCERQCFGYNQFTNAFNQLLNKCIKIYKFETFLQKDRNKLDEKIQELHNISKVRAVLIPPNPNGKSVSTIKDRCTDSNSKKMIYELESDDMRMESDEMVEIREYVSSGYGDLMVTGINKNGRRQRVSSSMDAAYCVDIDDNLEEAEFNIESQHIIISFEKYIHEKEHEDMNKK